MEIIPAILTNDANELASLISKAEGITQKVQIDIIDGVFANNKTVDPSALEELETNLFLDFHLMTKEPVYWVERCIRGQADRIIGQIEKMSDQLEFIGKVQEAGAKCGLGIDLKTPLSNITPQTLSSVDVILIMSVPAGFAGQEFDPTVLAKLKELNDIRSQGGHNFRICVDGGVTPDLMKKLKDVGVDEVAIGKRVFEGDIKQNLDKFSIS